MTERTAYKPDVMAERAEAVANERRRCIQIIRDGLDMGEYERSLGQAIVRAILAGAWKERNYKVVEVQIAPPHERRVMAVELTEQQADAFIKMAVIRRGVETHVYVAEPVKP